MKSNGPSVLRSVLKGTALYTVAMIVQRVAGVILLPVNTRFLNPTDYGVLELLEQTVTVLSVLLGIHISGSLGYFYFGEEREESRHVVVSTMITGATAVGLLAAVLGLVLLDPLVMLIFGSRDYKVLLGIVFATLPLTFAVEAEFGWLRVTDRPGLFTIASAVRVAVTIVATVLLVAMFKMGVFGVVISSVLAVTTVAVMLTIYCIRRTTWRFDRATFVKMARFAIPVSLGSIAMFVIHFGDRFILPHYRPLADLGIYGVAYKIGMLLSMLSSSFHAYWSAQVFAVAKREDAKDVIARIFTYVTLVLAFALLGLSVFSYPVLHVMATRKFESAAALVPLLAGAYFIRGIAEFFQRFFAVVGRPDYDAICNWVAASVCLISYFLLIPPFGIWGAALATALTFLVIAVIAMVWTYRLNPYRIEVVRVVKLLGITGGLMTVYLLVPVLAFWWQLALAVAIMAAFPALLWVVNFAEPAEIERVRSILGAGWDRAHLLVGRRARA